ncbi:MAG: hypothetical protein M1816_003205 [Peltula sp. TS41687]|nr:MAG: hypothetical protein M1816_003205 [Peltula sp. TS41687]
MSSDTQQALIRRSTDTELMPPPPTKRIKRPPKVLDEDTYTDALSTIIARDFFPGLLETQTQQEYLDALESQNSEWIASAGRKLTEVMTPVGSGRRRRRGTTSLATPRSSVSATPRPSSETPRGYGGDTPMSVISTTASVASSTQTQTPPVDLNLSLDRFQAKYTSEDNESFNKVLDKQNAKRAEKYRWLWAGNKIPAARQIAQRERETRLLQARREQEQREGQDDGGKPTRQLMIAGQGDERKATPETWKARPDNQVFFTPDGVEDAYETVQQSAEARSRAPPKQVAYGNTRLELHHGAVETDPAVPPSPSLSAIQDAIAGRPRATDSEPGYSGAQTPRVNGYAFVDDEPTPAEEDAVAAARLLGSGDATPNPFKIQGQSKRESLHHRMVDRVARNNRSITAGTAAAAAARRTAGEGGGTPTPGFGGGSSVGGSPRIGGGENLTPAAQKLLNRVATARSSGGSPRHANGRGSGLFEGRVASGIKGKGKESGLRYRWTPTPRAQRERGVGGGKELGK